MDITISRSSWHYRFTAWAWDHFGKTPSNSLCGYFWQMVLSPFVVLAFWGIITVVVLLTASFVLYLSGMIISDLLNWIGILPDSWDVVPGKFNWRHLVLSIVMNGSFIGYLFWQQYKVQNHKGDSVVFQYIKAKKRKICPFINYVD